MNLFHKIIEKLYFRIPNNLALYDHLTGLYNYNWIVAKGLKKYANKAIYITAIDLNCLKEINDTKGHAYGNQIIMKVADQLAKIKKQKFCHNADAVRFGGDEFVVFSEANIADYIQTYQEGADIISFGIYYKSETEDIVEAMKKADIEMYKNKEVYHQLIEYRKQKEKLN